VAAPLTTTHYALLCLLSAREWTAYELVGQMERSVGAVWPRAQSNLYADLKRLATDGMADAVTEHIGRRPRTTYRITRHGRALLGEWLSSPGAAPSFECEALLKLAFAPSTTKEATIAQLDVITAHAEARLALGRRLGHEHADNDGTGPLPERLHVNAVMWRYLWDMHHAMARWARWAKAEIEQWPDTQDSPQMRRRGLTALQAALGDERVADQMR